MRVDATSAARLRARPLLERLDAAMERQASVTTYLEHVDRDFKAYDAAYREFFTSNFPARATVEAHIVGDPIVEIQVIAVISHA